MKLTDYSIGTRLGVLAGMLMLSTLVVGIAGWHRLAGTNDAAVQALERAGTYEQAVDTARSAQVQFKIQVQEWKNILLRGSDPAAFNKYRTGFEKEANETQTRLRRLSELYGKLGLDAAAVDEAVQAHADLGAKYAEALKDFDPGKPESPHKVDGLVKGMDRAPTKKIDEIVDFIVERSQKSRQQTESTMQAGYRFAAIFLLSVMLLAIAAGAAVTVWLVRSITRPLNNAVDIARRVAEGDLTAQIENDCKGETGQLLDALHDMNGNLARIVGEVRSGTDLIAAASTQVASGNMDLSSRTEEQAASLEETAASIEELTSTVRNNAESAKHAHGLARSTAEVAEQGGRVVARVVDTMDSIKESSRKVVDIIGVIDSIAFQTNILALNAAVEAARAGEQGRGFAVVASEVRNLAQRSAGAAKEIKALIGDAVDKVDNGVKLVDEAGVTIRQMVESVGKLTGIMSEIADATTEQSSGIDQINQAIVQMDDATQKNAALVEEVAAAAASLQQQSEGLAKAVGAFRIAGQHAWAAPVRRSAPLAVAAAPARARLAAAPARPVRPARASTLAAPARPAVLLRTGTDAADWDEF